MLPFKSGEMKKFSVFLILALSILSTSFAYSELTIYPSSPSIGDTVYAIFETNEHTNDINDFSFRVSNNGFSNTLNQRKGISNLGKDQNSITSGGVIWDTFTAGVAGDYAISVSLNGETLENKIITVRSTSKKTSSCSFESLRKSNNGLTGSVFLDYNDKFSSDVKVVFNVFNSNGGGKEVISTNTGIIENCWYSDTFEKTCNSECKYVNTTGTSYYTPPYSTDSSNIPFSNCIAKTDYDASGYSVSDSNNFFYFSENSNCLSSNSQDCYFIPENTVGVKKNPYISAKCYKAPTTCGQGFSSTEVDLPCSGSEWDYVIFKTTTRESLDVYAKKCTWGQGVKGSQYFDFSQSYSSLGTNSDSNGLIIANLVIDGKTSASCEKIIDFNSIDFNRVLSGSVSLTSKDTEYIEDVNNDEITGVLEITNTGSSSTLSVEVEGAEFLIDNIYVNSFELSETKKTVSFRFENPQEGSNKFSVNFKNSKFTNDILNSVDVSFSLNKKHLIKVSPIKFNQGEYRTGDLIQFDFIVINEGLYDELIRPEIIYNSKIFTSSNFKTLKPGESYTFVEQIVSENGADYINVNIENEDIDKINIKSTIPLHELTYNFLVTKDSNILNLGSEKTDKVTFTIVNQGNEKQSFKINNSLDTIVQFFDVDSGKTEKVEIILYSDESKTQAIFEVCSLDSLKCELFTISISFVEVLTGAQGEIKKTSFVLNTNRLDVEAKTSFSNFLTINNGENYAKTYNINVENSNPAITVSISNELIVVPALSSKQVFTHGQTSESFNENSEFVITITSGGKEVYKDTVVVMYISSGLNLLNNVFLILLVILIIGGIIFVYFKFFIKEDYYSNESGNEYY